MHFTSSIEFATKYYFRLNFKLLSQETSIDMCVCYVTRFNLIYLEM